MSALKLIKPATILEKYIATIVLHSLGDTIGFKNGEWEFNYFTEFTEDASLELLYEFIHLGGINRINLEGWHVSDDTFYNVGIAEALLRSNYNNDDFYVKVKEQLLTVTLEMTKKVNKKKVERYFGATTINYVLLFKDPNGKDGRTMPFDPISGGSGCAMRTLSIGLALFGESNRKKLIEIAIETSRLTHNSPIGYLGGLVTALFTAYAIEGIHIYKWPYLLMDILLSDDIKSRMIKPEEMEDYEIFLKYWRRYLDTRFKNKEPIKTKANTNILYRTHYYNKYFVTEKEEINGNPTFDFAGSTGYSAPIVAYDCLIDAEDNWEKLVIYSMLHIGDSDTTGCIAAGLYGAMYGFGDVPNTNLKYLELKTRCEKIGEMLYKKFYLNEKINY
jgi:ADP-ribosylarginine hydrolase